MFEFEKIYVDNISKNDKFTRDFLARANGVPVEPVESVRGLLERASLEIDPLSYGKRNIILTHNRGGFLKPCPGTSHAVCCNYYFLDVMQNCPMDCHYCFLQGYLNNPYLVIYTNLDALFDELDTCARKNKIMRIGTGELADSLALDNWTRFSEILIPFFSKHPHLLLELKTKSNQVETLLNIEHNDNIIISWTVNSREIAGKEEKDTVPLGERIDAAARVIGAGYRTAFHFDPIIRYPGWKDGYAKTVRMIFDNIPADKISWISLGAFRFSKQVKKSLRSRFPESMLTYDEFIPGKDGKFRYPRPVRQELYTSLIREIHKFSKTVNLYMCMETPELWQDVLEKNCADTLYLKKKLDDAISKKNH